MRLLAAALWLLCGLAVLDLHAGNPTAIDGVIGAGLCAAICTVLAVVERGA